MIAERSLKLKTPKGDMDIPVRILAPRLELGGWLCRYEIDWPEGQKVIDVGGVDSMQALIGALQMIASNIYISKYHEDRALYFSKEREGYGFPVSKGMRDMLLGDDAEYL